MLVAIIISGKIAKQQAVPPAIVKQKTVSSAPKTPVVLAHESTNATPVKTTRRQDQAHPTNSGIVIEMY